MTMSEDGAATYVPWAHPSPLLDALGSLLQHPEDPLRIGFTVGDPKANSRGLLHAAALVAIADVAIGHALAAMTDPPTPLVTVNLSCDFLGVARLGEWVDGQITVNKMGRRLASGTATFTTDQVIAHATGLFLPVSG
jgi:acyl-coenzyme A thioesterase 13